MNGHFDFYQIYDIRKTVDGRLSFISVWIRTDGRTLVGAGAGDERTSGGPKGTLEGL